MNDVQFLAERIARLSERLAILETGQTDGAATGERTTLTGNTVVASGHCLVLESLTVPTGYYLEVASGASLVLVG